MIVVGAGPSGLATAACLNRLSIPNIVLEREDCIASLWKKKSYDRLHLHLPKQFCELPHMSFPPSFPTYVSRQQFLEYLDEYVSHFKITPMYQRLVEFATYDQKAEKWIVRVRNTNSDETENYSGKFLVVATGENSDPFIPDIDGLKTFTGQVIHSTRYKNGKEYSNKRILVVGSGNSGMEIALDLSNHGAKTSMAVRSPLHILSREMMHLGLVLIKYIRFSMVDKLLVILSKLIYGDLTKYGISRAPDGPFSYKLKHGKYPVVDLGTYKKIKSGEIQVLPGIRRIEGGEVEFENGKFHSFDVIVFATGFKTSTDKWLKEDDYLLYEEGCPRPSFPKHWKGKNGIYCAGLARKGLYGAFFDAQDISNDIKALL